MSTLHDKVIAAETVYEKRGKTPAAKKQLAKTLRKLAIPAKAKGNEDEKNLVERARSELRQGHVESAARSLARGNAGMGIRRIKSGGRRRTQRQSRRR